MFICGNVNFSFQNKTSCHRHAFGLGSAEIPQRHAMDGNVDCALPPHHRNGGSGVLAAQDGMLYLVGVYFNPSLFSSASRLHVPLWEDALGDAYS